MKKKKGFTLVELLAVIVILAIIAVIAIPSILKIINNAKESAFERQKEFIVDAAKKYGTKYPEALDKGYITISELVSAGLISGNIKDNKGNVIDNEYVVSTTNGYKLVGGTTKSGGSIVINNSTGAPIKRIKISGKSEQVQTVQGKNLLNHAKSTLMSINHITGAETAATGRYVSEYIRVEPDTKYTISRVISSTTPDNSSFGRYFYDENKVFISGSVGYVSWSRISPTTPANCAYMRISYYINDTEVQLELGSTATSYEPFIPNSPSPDYPSPINSLSNFDLIITDGAEQTQTIHFSDTLRSLSDGTKDYIEIDNVNKTAKLYRNVGEKVFNGTESFLTSVYWRSNLTYAGFYINLPNSINTSNYIALSSHFKGYHVIKNTHTAEGSFISPLLNILFYIKKQSLDILTADTDTQAVTKFNSWLANQKEARTPVTVQYKLASPTIANLDYNTYKNISTYQGVTNISKTGLSSEMEVELYTN